MTFEYDPKGGDDHGVEICRMTDAQVRFDSFSSSFRILKSALIVN